MNTELTANTFSEDVLKKDFLTTHLEVWHGYINACSNIPQLVFAKQSILALLTIYVGETTQPLLLQNWSSVTLHTFSIINSACIFCI